VNAEGLELHADSSSHGAFRSGAQADKIENRGRSDFTILAARKLGY